MSTGMEAIIDSMEVDLAETMNVKVVTITPKIAAEMLEFNPINRIVKRSGENYLAYEMLNNRFKYNGEAIIVSDTWILEDGQYRLRACIIADKPFKTLLVTNIPEERIRTIDTGTLRSASDNLTIHFPGIKNVVTVAATINKILTKLDKRGKRLVGRAQENIKISNNEVLDFYAAHKDTIDILSSFGQHLYGLSTGKELSGASIASLIYLSSYDEDNMMIDFLTEFMVDSIFFNNSNVAKKMKEVFGRDRIKHPVKDDRIKIRLKINYIMNAEKIYRTGVDRKAFKLAKMKEANFTEDEVYDEPKIDFARIRKIREED